jgi:type III secretion system FlhB-like substrate exporter
MRNQEKGKNLSRAVALRYTPKEDRAPKVTAKGSGPVAEKIIALAK